jgi:hypothetical protein
MPRQFNNDRIFTQSELIGILKKYFAENGEVPTQRELGRSNGLPSKATFSEKFGSYNNAIIAAGLEPRPAFHSGQKLYSDEDLFKKLKEIVLIIGHIPTHADFEGIRGKGYPQFRTYTKRFGTFENALLLSGIRYNRIRYWLLKKTGDIHKLINSLAAFLREPYKVI